MLDSASKDLKKVLQWSSTAIYWLMWYTARSAAPRVASVLSVSYQRKPTDASEKSENPGLTFREEDFVSHFPKHHSKARLCFLALTCEISFREQPTRVTITRIYEMIAPRQFFATPPKHVPQSDLASENTENKQVYVRNKHPWVRSPVHPRKQSVLLPRNHLIRSCLWVKPPQREKAGWGSHKTQWYSRFWLNQLKIYTYR